MSIITKTGDDGTTALLYGRRVSKSHPRVEACGTVDELNAALGLARAMSKHEATSQDLLPIQKELVGLMGELATEIDDLSRYARDGFPILNADATSRLDAWAKRLEQQLPPARDWVMPGGSQASAALDLARTICRRAERQICALCETGQVRNHEIRVYLNRLSDLLWLLARWADQNTR
ncbi:MAG: cob(I)yrinic acid a,c-diamide adenosyltransferase [Verrucomicrobiota bacterium]